MPLNEIILDARGQVCPKPLIMTKKALLSLKEEDFLKIYLDDDTSFNNVKRFLIDNKVDFDEHLSDGQYVISVSSKTAVHTSKKIDAYCDIFPLSNDTVLIKSNKMGEGPEELGEILLKAFINTLIELKPLPSKLIFYNSGILLTLKDSYVIDSLKELEEKKVKILVCGTCVNYFNKKDEVHVGIISNMYDIMEVLISSSKIINP